MPWMMGGGKSYPSWFILHPPKTLEQRLCTDNENDFQVLHIENDENTSKFRHFLHVYKNQSLEMPWMTGGGQPILAGLSYPRPMIFDQ